MLTKTKKTNLISKFQLHKKDTGSPDVQIALITERIDYISEHLKTHKKDVHSRKGLLKLVSKRLSHMKYLQRKDSARHATMSNVVKGK